ncbi:Uma2 family endonuclease [Streptacidiphilus sp. MAP12-20]|uniref:Uma2 family endonuclease n=1 Tax=Streptacidiphilus sp. MAP12-20 TaxID=3156299 RepID=UPI003517189B
MSAAATEHHRDDPATLLQQAERMWQQLPEGYRVEIIGSQITVTPPPDSRHGITLTDVMLPFLAAGLHSDQSKVVQGVGLWLPTGPSDFAIPDLAVVDADIEDHCVEANCYDPAVFRLVLEVSSSNYATDLRAKVSAYAAAHVPVYVIVDRRHERLHLLTSPQQEEYASHRVHAPGESVTLPASIGAEVTLDVASLLSLKS